MARIAVTSDLHYDTSGRLTAPAQVEALAQSLAPRDDLQAIVLAGDLSHGLDAFTACLRCFTSLGPPVAVLAGNHDVWRDKVLGIDSQTLWQETLAQVTRAEGAIWLEEEILALDDAALLGSIAWYDYSAIGPDCTYGPEDMEFIKSLLSNDARWIDWPWDDRSFAAACLERFESRLAQAADQFERLSVATHVPVLRAQIPEKPGDQDWSLLCTFLANYSFGDALLTHPKVRSVFSGHLHLPIHQRIQRPGLPPLDAYVIGSHYKRPVVEIIDI